MIAPRLTGLAMMVIQAFLLWRSMGYAYVAIAFILLAAPGCWPRLHRDWPPRWRHGTDVALAAAFAVWWVAVLQSAPQWSNQYGPNVLVAAGHGCIALQAVRFYRRGPSGPGPLFPILGVMSLACAGDRYLGGAEEQLYFWGAMAHGLLVALYYAAAGVARAATAEPLRHRAYRYAVLAACLFCSFALAAGTAWTLRRSDRFAQPWMASALSKIQHIAPGNSNVAHLGSMAIFDRNEADRIAIQIASDAAPGYLRGQIYGDFGEARWNALRRGVAASPLSAGAPPGYRPVLPGERLFSVAPGDTLAGSMEIYPDSAIQNALFIPLYTGWIGMATDEIVVDKSGIAQVLDNLNGRPFRALLSNPPPPDPLSESDRELFTRIPDRLAPRLRELAATVCGEHEGPRARAFAVTQYFHGNYQYALDFQASLREDPVEKFLFSDPKPSAHCEYFATGATLLLRAAGIPARYVTGVVSWEQLAAGGYWVARNRDAHAWCEAWDPELGWFIVEATPANGVPEAARGAGGPSWRDSVASLRLSLRRIVAAVRAGAWGVIASGTGSIAAALAALFRAWGLHVLPAAFLLGVALWWWRRGPRFRRARPAVATGLLERRLAKQIATMDRRVARAHGLVRRESRTPHAFAREIESRPDADSAAGRIAGWYRRWAETRYGPAPDPAAVDRLETDLAALGRKSTRPKPR
ncbi:MAG: transglutaminase domain-containing protein [Candidatus Hydrogenedentes bacterium]|nr:transglutaminase domain-containing protein [Candidatus Hydrogenedentota bacterium]